MLTPAVITGIYATLAAGVGAAAGAYVATAAVRRVRDETAISGRSQCDHCGISLGWAQTVPFVSGLVLKGRCASCGQGIDRLHAYGEVAGAIALFVTVCLVPWPQVLAVGPIAVLLLALALIDIKTFRLPNGLVLAVAFFGAILAVVNGQALINLGVSVAIWGVLSGLQWALYRRLKQTALGSGDIKLRAALALWLGTGTIYMLLLASLVALVVMVVTKQKGHIAFGPYLCSGGFVIGLILQSPVGMSMISDMTQGVYP